MSERPQAVSGDLPVYLRSDRHDTLMTVRVIPRAGRTALAGERAGALLVRLAAAPVDGAANEALLDYLAESFAVSRRSITLVSGERSRDKQVRISGVSPGELAVKLGSG